MCKMRQHTFSEQCTRTSQPFPQHALLVCVLHNDAFEDDGSWFLAWVLTYCFLLFVVVLLLNMLIALLGDTFSKTQDESILQGRIAYAQCVLRLELIAASTNAAEKCGEADKGPERCPKTSQEQEEAKGTKTHD